MKKSISICHYYVDETGDGNIFGKRGKVIIGSEGCSRFFMLGILHVENPESLTKQLKDLRSKLLMDPYFKNVPSIQPETQKTALVFHAKEDIPEVRREVFALLRSCQDLHFYAVVSEKQKVLEYVRYRNEADQSYRYHPNELYDYMVQRLFRGKFHNAEHFKIFFARRGRSDRTGALHSAINSAQKGFYEKQGIGSAAQITIHSTAPHTSPGLQASDYFLWALQRLFELGEDRYLNYIWHAFQTVVDIHDRQEGPYGTYYTQKRPLTKSALAERR